MNFTITPAAQKFMRMMLRVDGSAGSGFRLAVSPGGCSGLVADISVRADPQAGDAVVERDGVKLFLPAESRLLLDGVRPGDYPRGGSVHLRLWAAEQLSARLGAAAGIAAFYEHPPTGAPPAGHPHPGLTTPTTWAAHHDWQ